MNIPTNNNNRKINLMVLPVEIVINIIKFLDIVTLEKVVRVLNCKRNNDVYFYLQEEVKKNIQNKLNYNSKLHTSYILNKLTKNIEFQIQKLININDPFIFITNNNDNSFYRIRKIDLINIYGNKLKIIKTNYNNLTIEQVILLFKNMEHSEKYCVYTRYYAYDAENIGYENMFNSHINNCVCRTIHEWCKGKYCEGCKKCESLFPTPYCLNIKQWDFRLPISSLPPVALERQRLHSL